MVCRSARAESFLCRKVSRRNKIERKKESSAKSVYHVVQCETEKKQTNRKPVDGREKADHHRFSHHVRDRERKVTEQRNVY